MAKKALLNKERIKKIKKQKEREDYVVSKPTNRNEYKIIQNVSNMTYYIDIDGTPTKLFPHSNPVYIPVSDFNRFLRGTMAIKDGVIIELDENGDKIIADNPNVVLDYEIEDIIKLPLRKLNKVLSKITSPQTLQRILNVSKRPTVESGVAAAVESRYNDVVLPKGEPPLDLDMWGRHRTQ